MNESAPPTSVHDGSGADDPADGADAPAGSPHEGAGEALSLVAYQLPRTDDAHAIVPAPVGRAWMRETDKQFAHRCLPMLMANQSGWFLLSPCRVEATWDGGRSDKALRIEHTPADRTRPAAISIFGYGILTWSVDYLFRTPPGYNLVVRGPVNLPKDGIQALEGLVETDWAVATFTMNWKLTRPDHPVVFEAGEPFCMIVPQRRHELERFDPSIRPIGTEPALSEQWSQFQRQRLLMAGMRKIALRKGGRDALDRIPFERHYFEGTSPGGASAPDHQTKRSLRRFTPPDTSADSEPEAR